jgi:hypothetical protein
LFSNLLEGLLEVAQAAGVYSSRRKLDNGERALTPQSQLLASEVWSYAYPVLKAALGDDAAFSRARRLVGLPYLSDEAREAIMLTAYHRDDLAAE